MAKITIPTEFHNWAMKWLKKENEKEFGFNKNVISQQRIRYDDCKREIKDLVKTKAQLRRDGKDDSGLDDLIADGLEEKKQIEQSLNKTERKLDDWLKIADNWFSFAETAKEAFQNGDIETKKVIFGNISPNLTLKGRKLNVYKQKPLLFMEEAASAVNSIFQLSEPAKKPVNTRELEGLFEASPSLLRKIDNVRTQNWPELVTA